MGIIKLHDKYFKPYLGADKISDSVVRKTQYSKNRFVILIFQYLKTVFTFILIEL